MIIKVKKLHKDAIIPSYATYGDACFDLTCVSVDDSNEAFIQYNTGIAVEIPEGYVGLIFARSSITKKDLILKNGVGVIDSGYRGEIGFRFWKTKTPESNNVLGQGARFWNIPELYNVGERIGQMMIMPIPHVELEEVEELSDTDRGEGGFGSTGN